MIHRVTFEKDYSEIFEIDFLGENLPSAESNFFSVLIGPNGTSKSMILGALANYIRTGTDKMSASNNINIVNFESYSGLSEAKEKLLGRTIAISMSPFDRFYPKSSHSFIQFNTDLSGKGNYFYLGLKGKSNSGIRNTKDRVYEAVLSGLTGMHVEQVKNALQICFQRLDFDFEIKLRWRRAKKLPNTNSEIDMMVNLIAFSSDLIDEANELSFYSLAEVEQGFGSMIRGIRELEKAKVIEVVGIYVKKSGDGVSFDLLDASSGELAFLLYYMDLAAHLADNSTIFIDEPEISLHPNWQSSFLDDIQRISSFFKGCHFIIATHSPQIVTGLPVDSSRVIGLVRGKDRKISVREVRTPSGWSVEKILLDVFGVQTVRNSYFEREVRTLLYAIADTKYPNRKGVIKRIISYLEEFNLEQDDPMLPVINEAKGILVND